MHIIVALEVPVLLLLKLELLIAQRLWRLDVLRVQSDAERTSITLIRHERILDVIVVVALHLGLDLGAHCFAVQIE